MSERDPSTSASSTVDDRETAPNAAQQHDTAGEHEPEERQPTAVLRARIEQLQTENQRLRREYAATQRSRYRRTAGGLYLIGAISVAAALLFPDARDVLFALGATGLFAGLLTYYLTPERFVAARVSDRIATANTATLSTLVADLGLQNTQVYLPLDETANTLPSDVLLFVPQATQYDVPSAPTPGVAVSEATQERGLVVVPTGGVLLREFERAATTQLSGSPDELAEQLTDAITDQFELANTAKADTAAITDNDDSLTASSAGDESGTDSAVTDAGRITVVTEDPVFDAAPIDHPIASLVAASAAKALDTPVTIVDSGQIEDRSGYRVTVEWS